MEREKKMAQLSEIANKMGVQFEPPEEGSLDGYLGFLEKMREEGLVVAIKLDGERTEEDDNGPYTAIVTGKTLNGDFFRTDAHNFEDAIFYIVEKYSQKFFS